MRRVTQHQHDRIAKIQALDHPAGHAITNGLGGVAVRDALWLYASGHRDAW